ncbi:transcription factor IIF subunit tfg1 [Collariella sp. IMI 366227]|nr:transcription factor IIF subunit tfg1 [Collariella sp. IMI 366227]
MSGAPPPPAANGAPRPQVIQRRPMTANPLVARKKTRPKPAFARPPNEANHNTIVTNKIGDEEPEKLKLNDMSVPAIRELAHQRAQNGGWSQKFTEGYQDFPLVMTKRSMLEGIRHHIMRLSKGKGEGLVDITNQDQFPRPVTLLRRDPRLPPAHKMVMKEEPPPMDPAEAAEYERIRQIKVERDAQRALDQAQIAPVARGNEPKRQNNKKEKTTAFYGRNSDTQKRESKIHYEETWPWHVEDAEGKAGVWVGSYIASLSDVHVALVIDGARFRMIPLERYYKFDEKPKFDTLSLDDAEKMMYEVKEIKRWVMKQKDQEQMEKEKNETRQFLRGPTRVKTESATSRMARRTERQDDYELDVSGDEFQDDDEAPGFEADDEDTKDSKDRIRREQVAANTFGEGEEDKVEKEEREEQLEKLKRKMMGKQTVKTLKKLEHAMDYEDMESGDENNPFTDSSDSEEEDKDEDEKEDKEDDEAKDQKGASGANSKGNTTPSGRQRTVDLNKKGKLKRLGSPNMSESSDNEAARKKLKTGLGSVAQSRGTTPLPGRPKPVGAAMSDGEATAGEGSDAGVKLKKKLKVKGVRPGGTPSGSRAGSPAPGGKPKSDTVTPSGSPPPGQPAAGRIQASDIAEALAPYAKDGIPLSDFFHKFKKYINKPGNITQGEWMQMVKALSVFGADKRLRPKTGAESPRA